ncbi:MAG: SMP-30/gluconolactonase/LRE family protein [Gemmatimonadaceae bacterium]
MTDRDQAQLHQVATFDHQVTGVSVSKGGRIFVNFPRWTEDAAVSVAELMKDGQLRPYPNDEWNSWRNSRKNEISPNDHWVCVQSVVADQKGNLWVLDPAAPANSFLVQGGPKLVRIDLASNTVAQTIAFDETSAPQGTYLNDVRFSHDGKQAYITDSGVRGAIIVVDLQTGKARRTLDGHPSTQMEKDVVVKTDGKPLHQTDGRPVAFSADGIAMSPDGQTLYWQALTGKTLYRIPTAALDNAQLSATDLAAKVERVGVNGVADGLWMDEKGRMYITSPEEDAVKIRDNTGGKLAEPTILVQDKRLRWPDTFSEGPDGSIYFTTSHIQDMSWFKPENGVQIKTQLWQITMK